MSLVIRPAEIGDEEALTRIEQEAWSPRVSPIAAFTAKPFFEQTSPDQVLVGVVDDEVAGFLSFEPGRLASNAHVWTIANLGVAPSMRRKGVAGALLEAVEASAAERKIERLRLRVLSVNTAARSVYERHGYQIEGELRGEFRLPVGPGGALVPVDDVLMAKSIKLDPQEISRARPAE